MVMIACPDCKKEMSDTALSCPSCGRPNPNAGASDRPVGILLGIAIFFVPIIFSWFTLRKGHSTRARVMSFAWLAFCLLVLGAGNSGSRHGAPAASSFQSSTPLPTEQVIQVAIQRLLSDYKNNEVAADNKYKGNSVQVTGLISDVKKDILNNLYVTIGTGAQFEIPEVQAYFDDSMNNRLAGLTKGQRLTVICRIDGLMMNVVGKDCTIP